MSRADQEPKPRIIIQEGTVEDLRQFAKSMKQKGYPTMVEDLIEMHSNLPPE